MRTRRNYQSALRMLRTRAHEAERGDESAVADVVWAVRTLARPASRLRRHLLESSIDEKRGEMIEELAALATRVEQSHDPDDIAALLAGLRAFLAGEEVEDRESDNEEGEMTCEACGHQQTLSESLRPEPMAVRMFREAFDDDFTPAPGASALAVFDQGFDDDLPSRPAFSPAADAFCRMFDDDALGVRRYGSALECFEAAYAG